MTQEGLAMLLYGAGAVQFSHDGFRLKIHQQYPAAPKPLTFLNFRPPPEGPLKTEFVAQIGYYMADNLLKSPKDFNATHVVGVPNAGTRIARTFSRRLTAIDRPVGLLQMKKVEIDGKDSIQPEVFGENFQPGDRVVIIDDVAASGLNILETAEGLRANGLIAEQSFVLIDRQEGARDRLLSANITLRCCWTLRWLIEHCHREELIPDEFCRQAISYPHQLKQFLTHIGQ